MKKLMKLMCVFALVFVAGCGASSSTDEQKEVVTNFFDYVKECDITKLKKVASEDVLSEMDLEKMEKELSQYTEEEYGKVFVDETNKFKKAIFKDLFTDIKIKDIKADGDKTTVKGLRYKSPMILTKIPASAKIDACLTIELERLITTSLSKIHYNKYYHKTK